VARDRPRTVVIGIGNPDRGDDAAGRLVAERLRGTLSADVEIAETDGESTALLALLDGADFAILIDACVSGKEPGTVHRFDVGAGPLPEAKFNLSTHGLGLAEAVELARALGQLPPRTLVYAIEARAFVPGAPLTPTVAAAVSEATAQISAELAPRPARSS
jgi:hydrogenase maturation protease